MNGLQQCKANIKYSAVVIASIAISRQEMHN